MPTQQKKNKKSIVTTSNQIVCQETSIQLSDQKMKNVLSSVYEQARTDATKFKISNYYGVFLSVALTLLVALLTCDFKPLGQIQAEMVKNIFGGCFILCAIIGFCLILVNVSKKHANVNEERDKAINKAITELITTYNDE